MGEGGQMAAGLDLNSIAITLTRRFAAVPFNLFIS